MAVTRASFAVCILLSLAAIAAADYYTPQSPPVYHPDTTPSPVYTPPVHKPTLPHPAYTPPVKKPTLPHPVYTPPVYTPPVTKPTLPPPVYKPKPETKPPTTYVPPSEDAPKPYVYSPPVKPYVPKVKITVAIDGVILCKHGYNTYPIKGAKAKLVCTEMDSYGKQKEGLVIYSNPSNEKGYFYLTVTDAVKDIALCKVKLHSSPVATCKNPTNVNKGLTGVPLSLYQYRAFPDKHLNLYSVGPFFFTGSQAPQPKY
ncbi:PREDICTED: proline-rich protein 3-like [Tarenaya hassleriana]|uniref:proline-rich protein 3-like n=1 Tax=Tarenaya hassleriana TaxID=28532 RepID=UPI00053C5897|nr:PREDICTED: proline-rich protein 3-like [Tarenaya hassleriana]